MEYQFYPAIFAQNSVDSISDGSYALFFHNDQVLMHVLSNTFILTMGDVSRDRIVSYVCLGKLNGQYVYAMELESNEDAQACVFRQMRQALMVADTQLLGLICRAKHLLNWHKISLFCGACGAKTRYSLTEQAKECVGCARVFYPSYSPAIIVSVERERQILLGRSPHFPKGLYSVLAGYIDPGETGEQAVAREVQEEVGVTVCDIKYFASQMWPFPNTFMVAYQARACSADITINPTEIEDAGWYMADNLPELLPVNISVSRQLIDDFVLRMRGD